MKIDVKARLTELAQALPDISHPELIQVPDAVIETDDIRIVMISEVVPQNPADYFYSRHPDPAFLQTTLPILNAAGLDVRGMEDILRHGIYITTAVKTPKEGYTIPTEVISSQLPLLEQELEWFGSAKAILLMGDVAKKAFNMIVKKKTKKNLIPSQPTYRIRDNEYRYGHARVFPSYIITGGNLLIEKGKVEMIRQDVAAALSLL